MVAGSLPSHGDADKVRRRRRYPAHMPSLPWTSDHPPLIVAAVTPLSADGEGLDEDAVWPMWSFLSDHGADGVFACGTTGEGINLSLDERRRMAVAFRAAVRGRLIVHAGAQTTHDTSVVAAHAAEIGADGVAVIPPPYFPLDEAALTAHFLAAAAACAPLPFFIYVFAGRSGYPVPTTVVQNVAQGADNLAGLKVSESPFAAVEPYLDLGLPVLIGSEPLLPPAMARGAVGSVSGMAAAFPDVVRRALDAPEDAEPTLRQVRNALEASGKFIASAKHVLRLRGVPVKPDMRAPLQPVSDTEMEALEAAVGPFLA
jgi:dihydrodipicolinate synthase/N-acetylneuraminate lyase